MVTMRAMRHGAAAVLAAVMVTTAVSAPAFAQAQGGAAAPSTQANKKEKPAPAIVNLNTAGATELQTLPGVGPAVAGRILEYRQKNGGFKKIEDLMNVRGIGEKTFLKLKPLITIAPPKSLAPAY